MSEQEMKVLHERMKKEDPKLLALMKKCFDAGVSSGKEQAKQEQPWREFASDYERGVIDGRQMQMQSSVDKAVNAMTRRDWVALTDTERNSLWREIMGWGDPSHDDEDLMKAIEDASRRKNT
jgi:hypothetical protein